MKFTDEICSEDMLGVEQSSLVETLSSMQNYDYIAKLFKLLSYPTVLQEKEFEITIYHSLRILKELVEKYELQKTVVDLGAMKMVVRLLSNASDDQGKVIYETICLANSILNGGNSEVQRALIEYLGQSNNEDGFFKKIHHLIGVFN